MKSRTLEAIREKYEPIFDDPDFYLESELFTLFNDVLKRLPESYREAFEMSRFDGMTHKEIADLLNVSRQTVNYRLSKALEILREELKDYMPVLFLLLL
jgi:RNA polymerase sigma-70 factor (ECF subfamily)